MIAQRMHHYEQAPVLDEDGQPVAHTPARITQLFDEELDRILAELPGAGDTVHAEVEVIAIRPTSKGNRGIVTTTNDVINQNGETVITYRAVRMMAGRPEGEA
jgi:hypothetical protein